jgi:hypothetical protein
VINNPPQIHMLPLLSPHTLLYVANPTSPSFPFASRLQLSAFSTSAICLPPHKCSRSVGDDGAEVLVLDYRMLPEYFCLVHFDHSLSYLMHTPVTFSQDAAPLMLFSTGDDSAKATPVFTSIMNFMQFMYINSSAYFSIIFA